MNYNAKYGSIYIQPKKEADSFKEKYLDLKRNGECIG
jgi:hypothetical protein